MGKILKNGQYKSTVFDFFPYSHFIDLKSFFKLIQEIIFYFTHSYHVSLYPPTFNKFGTHLQQNTVYLIIT
jgi:hypothetical protein